MTGAALLVVLVVALGCLVDHVESALGEIARPAVFGPLGNRNHVGLALRIFLRHVIPSERIWGGMFTVFLEFGLSNETVALLRSQVDIFETLMPTICVPALFRSCSRCCQSVTFLTGPVVCRSRISRPFRSTPTRAPPCFWYSASFCLSSVFAASGIFAFPIPAANSEARRFISSPYLVSRRSMKSFS